MDNEKRVLAKEALKALADIEDTMRIEEIVKDNKIEFIVNDINYRVRKPSFAERQELDSIRRKKYMDYVKDDSYMFKAQWITTYAKKGINIVEMENKVRSIDGEIKDTLLRLAKATEPKDISSLKEQVLKLRDEQFSISMEVTDLLTHSIENQLMIYVNSYTTYLVLEKKVEDNWVRAYATYEDFMKSEDKCVEQAFYYINILIYTNPINTEK